MTSVAAIIPAAGSGTRMKSSRPKQFLELAGKPILIHTIAAFYRCQTIDTIIVAVPTEHIESTKKMLARHRLDNKITIIAGGIRRQDSVKAGLEHLPEHIDIALVHDGARPLISDALIEACCIEAASKGAAIAAIPVKDTLKREGQGSVIQGTVDRHGLWQAQTPQAVKVELLRRGFAAAGERNVTDEASLLELAGIPVHLVTGSETNIKITRPEDLVIAEKLLMNDSPRILIGHGYDAHRFEAGRLLVLAGIEVDHSMGLAGHSDADVITHALCDAILGALGKGDIGSHFPDTSAEFKDISSLILLERVCTIMHKRGYAIGNGDITIVCQEPKLAPYISTMRATLAKVCGVSAECINIKATTTEKMGFTGRREGIGCHAVVLLQEQREA